MIKTQKLTPEIYYKESRDFQLFGRVYDVIFNYLKTNVDLMENFPINSYTDSKLIELLARTLGFNNRLSYRNDDLNGICNVFIKLIKQKGSINSVKTLVKTILNVEGISKNYDVSVIREDAGRKVVIINIPDVITNPEIKLMEDVLDYILPVGICYNIKTTSLVETTGGVITVNQYAEKRSFVADDNKYTNIYITKEVNQMVTTKKAETSPEPICEDIKNPFVGDLRYTKVVDKIVAKTDQEGDE